MATSEHIGLSSEAATARLQKDGPNASAAKQQHIWWTIMKDVVTEPVFIMLLIASSIYFFTGAISEGSTMLVALLLVAGIAAYQVNKSQSAIDALKAMSQPLVKVWRDGKKTELRSEYLVVGDVFTIDEGDIIPADAIVLEAHDFSVNESMLTGESLPIEKTKTANFNVLLKGSLVSTGSATAQVNATGSGTQFDKLAESIVEIKVEQSPLQKQIRRFVNGMIVFGAIAFVAVWVFDVIQSGFILPGLLHGLTIAMSVFPEEVPVAFSTFMALGAYHLFQQKVIVANPMTVETLGAATVICTDKTGTLTTNQMQLAAVYDCASNKSTEFLNATFEASITLTTAMWASESLPFDAMEKALHDAYQKSAVEDLRPTFKMVKEYPLGGKPPMMTHVFSNQKELIIAVKGSVEAVLSHSNASEETKKQINAQAEIYAGKGYRVLGVGQSKLLQNQLPEKQEDILFEFLGLVAFYDPPKDNIKALLQTFYKAGIAIKMITGDHPQTALSIAKQIGLDNSDRALTGDDISAMSETELKEALSTTSVFARMFPEAKLKVVEALKASGEIVAMTGDGVNDGPALKAAHIGIAMGLRGSEVAKRTASLVLMDDDLSHMAEAIESGRRIYSNLKKAILYIVSIHIPVILLVTLPVLLNWKFASLFNPIHVIFLELVMGPTCSIVFERELGNANAMNLPPRKQNDSLFSSKEFLMSASQGLIITLICISYAWYTMVAGESIELVRSKVFVILILSNVLLTLGSRSFDQSILYSLKRPNLLMPMVLGLSLLLLILIFTWPFLLHLFAFTALDFQSIVLCIMMALGGSSVIELYKWIKRLTNKTPVI